MDDENILLFQPSYIVFADKNKTVKAIGDEAYSMFEKNHGQLRPVKPLNWGVIADYESATAMIHEMVKRVYRRNWFTRFEHIISSVPYSSTEVERRALRNVMQQFNASRAQLFFEPLAAAVGMGLNIAEPEGKLVIDIGGGITEIVVISYSGIAVVHSLKVAGDSFTLAIQEHFRRNRNLLIGLKTAEQVKIQVGSATTTLPDPPQKMIVKGKSLPDGIPMTCGVDYGEIAEILDRLIASIEKGIIQTLEVCPPELSADIYESGIHLTGGSALLRGLADRFSRRIELPVHVDADPLLSVSKGISQALREPKKFKAVLFE